LGVVTGDLDASFGMSTSGGRVSGLDTAVSGLFGSHGVFSHHDVSAAMRDRGRDALARVDVPHLRRSRSTRCPLVNEGACSSRVALVTRPDALVLDEPTTGLDLVARHRFMETVRRLMREGTTLILITHHVDEIVPETRRVVLLRDGQVAYDGRPEDALTSARLGDVFGAALSVERAGDYYHVRVAGSW
jgi:iron complex transport system ATP-binding protein